MRRFAWLPVAVVAVLAAQSAVAQTGAFQFYDHQDLLFTAVTYVSQVEPLGDVGYVAATEGGLVLWTGAGARKVLTRTEGLPSSVINSIADADGELLVGTAVGAALVDPATYAVTPVIAEGAARPMLEGDVWRASTEGDRWTFMTRQGDVAVRDDAWTSYARPAGVRGNDLFVVGDDVLVAMEDPDAVFRLLANGTWGVLMEPDEPPIALFADADEIFVGTRGGGLEIYDREGARQAASLPDALETGTIIAFEPYGDELWVGTTWGIHIRGPDGNWRTLEPQLLPHAFVNGMIVLDSTRAGGVRDEAVLATPVGVAWPRFDLRANLYDLHTTINGPVTNQFLSASLRGNQVWSGTDQGASVFRPAAALWEHIGASDGLDSTPVYRISHSGSRAWMATQHGVYGLDLATDEWTILRDNDPALRPGNIFYDAFQDGDTVWMPELGNGLLAYSLDARTSDRYEIPDGLLSHGLTCAKRWHEFLAICSGEAFQLFNLSTSTAVPPLGASHDFCVGFACDSNYPAENTYDALSDGPRLWTATVGAGVVLIERGRDVGDTGPRVTETWDAGDGLPSSQVRSLAPAPNGVWVGTDQGLARIDVERGVVGSWDREDGLDDTHVNGLVVHEGILYVSTLAGLYRFDVEEERFLSLVVAGATPGRVSSSIRIAYPPDGATLRRSVNMTGTAQVPGRSVEAVEVQLDEGAWSRAAGTNRWSFRLPVDDLEPGGHQVRTRALVDGHVRAWDNNTFRVARPGEGTLLPFLSHSPPQEAVRGSDLVLNARVSGEAPLAVTLEAVLADGVRVLPGLITAGTATFTVAVPAEGTGDIAYRFFLQTAAGDAYLPADTYYFVPIREPRERDLRITVENEGVELGQGGSIELRATVTNAGNRAEDVRVVVTGTRPAWTTVEPDRFVVAPGLSVTVGVRVDVPEDGVPGATNQLVNAQTLDGVEGVSAPLRITVAPPIEEEPPDDRRTPLASLPLVVAALALVALGRRRR